MTVGIAVARRQVVLQLFERLKIIFPDLVVRAVCEGHTAEINGHLIVCTTHQLFRYHQFFDVLILDDILDEGQTMRVIKEQVMAMGAKSCKTAVFANKLLDHEKPITADYVGLDVPNRYVFGYGMDVSGAWRNLSAIYALKGH